MQRQQWIAIVIAGTLWGGPAGAHKAKDHSAVLVVEAATGAVLAAENATHPWYPASLTKVMTAYLVFEALAKGRFDLDEKVLVSERAAAQPPTKLGLGRGKMVSIDLLLEAMIVRSANDAAVVLAEAVSGSEAAFAAAMTRKARELGMTRTVFRNASGLPDIQQVTTARDMLILARALIANFPDHFGLFGKQQFTLGRRTYSTINGWMKGYSGGEGIKTGFTCGSGYNLLSSAKRDGRRLIGLILGAKSSGGRNSRMTKLMNAGFAKTPPSAADALLLDGLPSEQSRVAPTVLPGDKCISTAVIGGGRLPGWGVVFGSFASKAKAQETIKRNRTALKSLARRGRPAIIPKTRKGLQRYSALLVGLKQADAGQACQQLRKLGSYCLALRPERLNNQNAIWR
jgi:D-alanyl-D-alanine carboxypeptidase